MGSESAPKRQSMRVRYKGKDTCSTNIHNRVVLLQPGIMTVPDDVGEVLIKAGSCEPVDRPRAKPKVKKED